MASLTSLPAEHEQLAARLQQSKNNLGPDLAERGSAATSSDRGGRARTDGLRAGDRRARSERWTPSTQQRIAAGQKRCCSTTSTVAASWPPGNSTVQQPTAWTPLDPVELTATNQAKFETAGRSVRLGQRPQRQGDLQVRRPHRPGRTSRASSWKCLPTSDCPTRGRDGLQNGNFVLTEFRVEWAPEAQPDKTAPVALQNAQADFSQDELRREDGHRRQEGRRPNNGWATSPKTGENRTAVFETGRTSADGSGLLTF